MRMPLYMRTGAADVLNEINVLGRETLLVYKLNVFLTYSAADIKIRDTAQGKVCAVGLW